MNTQKALKVSKALIVLVLGVAWALLKAIFTLGGLLINTKQPEEERGDIEQMYAIDRTTDPNNKYRWW